MKVLLDWFIKNPIAANLLMVMILVGGGLSVVFINNEFFPDVDPLLVQVSVPYPGAGPLEVEEQICIKIEEAVSDVEGIREVRSTASQGMGLVLIEAVDDWDMQRLLNDVKNRVDAISTFPEDTEKPIVRDFTMRKQALTVVVAGGDNEAAIKELTLTLKDSLNRLPGVSEVEVSGIRDYEISVDIPETTLRAYGLSFDDIASAIRKSSLNLPAGQMRNPNGDVQIQVYGQDYRASDFEDIVIIKNNDGSKITLGQIATISDSFEEKNFLAEYDGKMATKLSVKVGENPDTIGIAQAVKDFLQSYALPPGYKTTVWSDQSSYLKDRLSILATNSLQGLILVLVLLLLFLRPALALWVSSGIVTAILGTIMVLPLFDTTINIISTFAFLLVLGILVDDAIVISENVHTHYELGYPGPLAASLGVQGVAKPVILSVVTTLMVFVPLLFLPGGTTRIFLPIPVVAITALSVSLLEALLILPSHLSQLKPEQPSKSLIMRHLALVRGFFTGGLDRFTRNTYLPILKTSLSHQGATLATFVAILAVCLSLLIGGWLPFSPMPEFQTESMEAEVTLQEGVGYGRLLDVLEQVEKGLQKVRDDPAARGYAGQSVLLDSFSSIDGSTVRVELNLISNDEREITTKELQVLWRKAIGEISGAENFGVSSSGFGSESDVNLRLAGPDINTLKQVSEDLKSAMRNYAGVYAINDSLSSARQEIRISLKRHGELLGLDLEDIARQVRHAFYGAEAERIPSLREDIKVMVRYPLADRATIENLTNMRIKLNDGTLVPFAEVADAAFVPGYTTINRTDRSRVVNVYADVVSAVISSTTLVDQIIEKDWPVLAKKYPEVRLALEGDQKDLSNMMQALIVGMIFVMLAMYALVAVEFKSYLQPFYILSAVPFGIAGSVIGHLLLGMKFSIPSAFGVMATAGVVVNSNLVLIDRFNNLRAQGADIKEAVLQGSRDRLRPILLTSLTTFFGLVPIVLEESPSATTLIPIAVALSFGVLFATTITLLMVPALYTFFETHKQRLGFAPGASVVIPPVPADAVRVDV